MIDNEFYRRYLFGDIHEEVSFNIFEVTNFYHAMRVKKYIGIISEIMQQELWVLQDEDEVILDIPPKQSNTIFCDHSMDIYTHTVISKVGRLPLEKRYVNNFAGKDLFEYQKAVVREDENINSDLKKKTFKYSWWGKDDEIYAMQEALKACLRMMMTTLLETGEPDEEVSVKQIYKVINEIKANSEGLPVRNPDVMDGETSDLALDAISKYAGDKDFVEKSVADICEHYKINIEQ